MRDGWLGRPRPYPPGAPDLASTTRLKIEMRDVAQGLEQAQHTSRFEKGGQLRRNAGSLRLLVTGAQRVAHVLMLLARFFIAPCFCLACIRACACTVIHLPLFLSLAGYAVTRLLKPWPSRLLLAAVTEDQRGSRYDEDLATLERLGILLPGAVVVADNVLKPGRAARPTR